MPNRSLFWPLSLLGVFAGLFILLISGALPRPNLVQAQRCSYPGLTEADCFATQTAQVTSYPAPISPTAPAQQQPAPAQPQATATEALTTTVTITTTSATLEATPTPIATITSTRQVITAEIPSPTLPSELEGVDPLICQPGATVTITGTAEGNVALLAYFNDRPVGGSFARNDGQYSITLHIGPERPGIYSVEVRERDGRALVQQLACEVPGVILDATVTPGP
jgi:hypothetical protein